MKDSIIYGLLFMFLSLGIYFAQFYYDFFSDFFMISVAVFFFGLIMVIFARRNKDEPADHSASKARQEAHKLAEDILQGKEESK